MFLLVPLRLVVVPMGIQGGPGETVCKFTRAPCVNFTWSRVRCSFLIWGGERGDGGDARRCGDQRSIVRPTEGAVIQSDPNTWNADGPVFINMITYSDTHGNQMNFLDCCACCRDFHAP